MYKYIHFITHFSYVATLVSSEQTLIPLTYISNHPRVLADFKHDFSLYLSLCFIWIPRSKLILGFESYLSTSGHQLKMKESFMQVYRLITLCVL